ncbi:hypothetical protein [Undibacterium rugosum]|uniref:hypothetical protein n=1 Tax=Undibacterium rugosum TaxID=2762291 RepID=UPI001B83295D|nr:hypothetical protein [Undibacterium rugosum]MBR7780335.1 hypothetical protein [Undibacterium rugosum]
MDDKKYSEIKSEILSIEEKLKEADDAKKIADLQDMLHNIFMDARKARESITDVHYQEIAKMREDLASTLNKKFSKAIVKKGWNA